MSSELAFLPASRGTLLLLRRKLQLVKRGKDVLQMRRDQLVKEVFSIMDELKKRPEAEQQYAEASEIVSKIRMSRGEHEFLSISNLATPPKIETVIVSYQGVAVPQARIVIEPDFSKITDPEYRTALEKLWEAVKTMIEVANKEIAVEKLCEQLQYINRVVNSLEKNLIPKLEDALHHIEERVTEEEIEEFVRIKLIGER
ncbi:MAG: hypothetical protein DRJ35_04685 [Thermoprotei archaeon]|nr:MAG: hypothetical protein DRJ35_04685 [Thermoprotei archaeon]